MSSVFSPQRKFLTILFVTLMCFRGKANFRNLSRYSELDEKTYSRWFRRDFDFVDFNRRSLESVYTSGHELVAAIDCSFCEKSGKYTYGLDTFYNSKQSKAEVGLELSTLAIVDVTDNTAYTLSARQTPKLENPEETRMDWYLQQLQQHRSALPLTVRYLVNDGYYSKTKFIEGTLALGLHPIGKLRHDANLRYLYTGPSRRRGRPKRYDGKVRFDDLSRFEFVEEVEGLRVYTAVVNSVHFKRNLRVVCLVKPEGDKRTIAVLFSTDLSLSAKDIYRFYKARFQIEFLFRDAKQFTGLSDCQARQKAALHTHFNAALTTLNLLKLEDRLQRVQQGEKHVISIMSWKIRHFNEHLMQRFSAMLGLDFSSIKTLPGYENLRNYGVVMA